MEKQEYGSKGYVHGDQRGPAYITQFVQKGIRYACTENQLSGYLGNSILWCSVRDTRIWVRGRVLVNVSIVVYNV